MGRSMGPLSDPRQDLSANAVLSAYRDGFMSPRSNFFLIATEPDDIMPMEVYYDFDKPCRDDALVCSVAAGGNALQIEFETLREAIAWSCFTRFKSAQFPRHCTGTFNDDSKNILAKLNSIANELGISESLPAGSFCGLYERDGLAMDCTVSPRGGEKKSYMFFELAANDEATIRALLGTIATETSIEVEIREWS